MPTLAPPDLRSRILGLEHLPASALAPNGRNYRRHPAAQRRDRRCYACEIDPRYADVILRRYQAETADVPVRLD